MKQTLGYHMGKKLFKSQTTTYLEKKKITKEMTLKKHGGNQKRQKSKQTELKFSKWELRSNQKTVIKMDRAVQPS